MSLRRRLAIGAVAVGLASIAPVTTTLEAGAGAAPGSGLGAVNVHAVAVGLRMPLYSHQGEDAEAELPYALSDIGGGGVSHALTSLFWPGATGGALGSTLGVLTGGKVPAFLSNNLNDPLKAEAPTTTGQTNVSMSKPGLIMQALALPTHVNSSSAIGLSNLSSFGNNSGPLITSTTNIAFKGANTVVADADAALTDLSIGPLYIGSVVTTAHATSNGKHADGTTQTKIADVKIAGIDVTIDQNGIELANKGILPASLITTLSKTINSALKVAGITITVTPASKSVDGAQVSLQAADLLVSLKQGGYQPVVNDTGTVLELGGASISANAIGGYVAPVLPTTPSSAPPSTSSGGGLPDVTPPPIGPGSDLAPTTAPPPPQLATNALALPGALSSWWVVGGVLLALLAALALGLLPGRALVAGADCSLEEES
ncbi:MAG TPA: hypothetical protein VHV76_11670 [Mycobacteriales bacterium]|nr:hypothetical protein [Mycobacteriales bacterium]